MCAAQPTRERGNEVAGIARLRCRCSASPVVVLLSFSSHQTRSSDDDARCSRFSPGTLSELAPSKRETGARLLPNPLPEKGSSGLFKGGGEAPSGIVQLLVCARVVVSKPKDCRRSSGEGDDEDGDGDGEILPAAGGRRGAGFWRGGLASISARPPLPLPLPLPSLSLAWPVPKRPARANQ